MNENIKIEKPTKTIASSNKVVTPIFGSLSTQIPKAESSMETP